MKNILTIAALLFSASASADWFEDLKSTGGDDALYRTLHYMPKGRDLHNHLCGSNFSERLYELALQQRERGYHYYTKVRIENCADYGGDAFGRAPYYLMFRNIMSIQSHSLSDCEKREDKTTSSLGVRNKGIEIRDVLPMPTPGLFTR